MLSKVRAFATGSEATTLNPENFTSWEDITRMFVDSEGCSVIPPRNVILSLEPSDFYLTHRVVKKMKSIEKKLKDKKPYKDGLKELSPDDTAGRDLLKRRLVGKTFMELTDDVKSEIMKKSLSAEEKAAADAWLASFEESSSSGGDEARDARSWADLEEEEEAPKKRGEEEQESEKRGDDDEEESAPWFDVKSSSNPLSGGSPYDVVARIMDLSLGLDYDRFDARRIREQICKLKPSIDDMVTILSAYISVGNNPSNLDTKVKDPKVGRMVLQVCNKFKIVRQKINSTTLTLARVAIAFSPAVLLIRMIKQERNSLSSSGIKTTTPVLYQDVSLSALSVSLKFENEHNDFLIKFNRELMKAAEKGKDKKTKEEDMDSQCQKFIDLSHSNASEDLDVYNWKLTVSKPEVQLIDFLSNILSKYST